MAASEDVHASRRDVRDNIRHDRNRWMVHGHGEFPCFRGDRYRFHPDPVHDRAEDGGIIDAREIRLGKGGAPPSQDGLRARQEIRDQKAQDRGFRAPDPERLRIRAFER